MKAPHDIPPLPVRKKTNATNHKAKEKTVDSEGEEVDRPSTPAPKSPRPFKRPTHEDISPLRSNKKKRRVDDDTSHKSDHVEQREIEVEGNRDDREVSASQSARSRHQETPNTLAIAVGREEGNGKRRGALDELKVMLRQVQEENKVMKGLLSTIVEKLDKAPIVSKSAPVSVKHEEVEEVPVTPKKLYEETMLERLNGIQVVFKDENLRFSLMKVIAKFIIKSVDGDRHGTVPPKDIPNMFHTLLYSVQRDMKGPMSNSQVGESASFIRRSVILDCLRQGTKSFDNPPFWLESVIDVSDDRQSTYLKDVDLIPGFERRERSRVGSQDSGARNRAMIANGTVKPRNEDDAEFIAWWGYGQLTQFLNPGRKNAIAILFEQVLYLYSPWWFSIADKKGTASNVNGRKSSNVSGRDIETVTSKQSLRIE